MRSVLVTGAGRGVGRECALAFARLGDAVACSARTESEIRRVEEECRAAGAPRAAAIPMDATDAASVFAAVERASAAHGPVEVLVHAAGGARTAPLASTDDSLWAEMLAVNLTSAFLVARAVVPAMTAARRGRLIFVGSTASRAGYRYCSAYAASKHGLLGMVRSLALEVAPSGVTANVVAPGFLDVGATRAAAAAVARRSARSEDAILDAYRGASPQGRLFAPTEVAAAAVFLASDLAAGIHGQCITIDGGSIASG